MERILANTDFLMNFFIEKFPFIQKLNPCLITGVWFFKWTIFNLCLHIATQIHPLFLIFRYNKPIYYQC